MVAHPFRTAFDTVDANDTEGGITETAYDAIQKRTAVVLGPTESLGDYSFDTGSVPLAIIHSATGYVYFYNADDTSADDGLTVLVTGDGKRYLIADASAIAVSSVLSMTNTPPGTPTDGDAYVVDTAPTGAWVGHAKDIALATPRGWVFAQPQIGSALLNQATGNNIQYSAAGSWGAMATALDAADVPPEALLFPAGLSVEAQQDAPPGSPSTGLYYIVGDTPSGDWTGHENELAYYTSTSVWAFIAAYDGATVFNKASDAILTWFDATGDWRAAFPIAWICQLRLTLESGVPISTTDQTAKATLYGTPFRGNGIALYVNGGWALRTFTEKSLSLAGYTAAKPFDIFGYDDSGVLALESLVWTDDTNRATALTLQDGILVKSGDATRRYLGTIYTSATGQCEDSAKKRYVWNYYGQEPRALRNATETTDSWSGVGSVLRQANGNTANQLDFVVGVDEKAIEATVVMMTNPGAGTAFLSIGLDSATTQASGVHTGRTDTSGLKILVATWRGHSGAGRHTLKWLERQTGTVTFYGDAGSPSDTQSGIQGIIWG